MTKPLVSVVMAAKNYARFLPTAVESVVAQTLPGWELLIVDDGSSDATPTAVRPYLVDSRVKYVRSDRLGQSRAKNLGIGLSRGRFVAFLDADDAWQPTKLEKQLARFTDGVAVVFCRRSLMNENGIELPHTPTPAPPTGRVLTPMFVQNFVCFSSVVVRREVFSAVGAFDPGWDLAIDYDLWLRVAARFGFDFVDEELVAYRTGHGNLSKKLADRVATALSIMHRAETRYAVGEEVPAGVIAAGYASTCRTLGYVVRKSEPLAAARWCATALRWPDARLASAKGLAAALLAWARGRREAGAAENATANV
ncbi:glycosyltransferase family 2 protein [Urbifossiella limnaea]|uniref:UDP-Glc:alpha-D-GlcNAc-diphosphoundecaprenol beta-1,3-glucosyltransferase WfgD n=1 Tax=Urbifossiella limnaea TaxID=2528023 RepID=A0A517XRB2_9BACT|nr:glycosyltransferase family A protein [Urbifossiella limnaea]QDU20045.1 UDP-Glc:alpha-D-GlcNAc-diphosphoundecaprenol beta-1,3-glucosyltransferase WfgD [Urbifossiella limnaea]